MELQLSPKQLIEVQFLSALPKGVYMKKTFGFEIRFFMSGDKSVGVVSAENEEDAKKSLEISFGIDRRYITINNIIPDNNGCTVLYRHIEAWD
jgi:hypothetical protein